MLLHVIVLLLSWLLFNLRALTHTLLSVVFLLFFFAFEERACSTDWLNVKPDTHYAQHRGQSNIENHRNVRMDWQTITKSMRKDRRNDFTVHIFAIYAPNKLKCRMINDERTHTLWRIQSADACVVGLSGPIQHFLVRRYFLNNNIFVYAMRDGSAREPPSLRHPTFILQSGRLILNTGHQAANDLILINLFILGFFSRWRCDAKVFFPCAFVLARAFASVGCSSSPACTDKENGVPMRSLKSTVNCTGSSFLFVFSFGRLLSLNRFASIIFME